MGAFGSDTTTKQLNVLRNDSITVSDQGVVSKPYNRNVGNIGANARVTTTVNNGLGQDDLTAFLKNIAGGTATGVGGWGSGQGIDDAVDDAVARRLAQQIDAGGELAEDNIQATGFVASHQWLMIGLGAFALIVAVVFAFLKRRKAA